MTPFVSDPDFTLYHGDVREVLPALEAESVDCCVTSPPYWGLRDYGADGQIGLESSPTIYVETLVSLFREVRRILKPQGVLWLNLGDTYAASRTYQIADTKGARGGVGNHMGSRVPEGLKPKDLIGVPWRVALGLQEDGWWLRSDVVWSKPNPMPESVTDRPTRSHEYIFLLTKGRRYFFDVEAISEPAMWYGPNGQPKSGPHAGQMQARAAAKRPQQRRAAQLAQQHGLTEAHFDAMRAVGIADTGKSMELRQSGAWGGISASEETLRLAGEAKEALGGYYREFLVPLTRNPRSVWEIQTMQYAEAHFAVFPEEIPRRCILAGCPVGGTVLDPFMGSGTTALVARRLGRQSVGIELNEDYCRMAARRLSQLSLLAEGAA